MRQPAVALNGRFTGTLQPTGTQITAFHLFDAIIRGERERSLVVFADPAFPGVAEWAKFPGVELVPVPFSRWRRFLAQLWVQTRFNAAARKHGCALAHHPITDCPRLTGGLRQVVTVHDLNFLHHPEWFGRSFRLWFMATVLPGIRAADHVVTVSDYVLRDVRTTLGLAETKSSRIYNGATFCAVQPVPPRVSPYSRVILGVNLWQPHKNLPRLLAAFRRLRDEFSDVQLHLAGRPQAHFRKVPELAGLLEAPGVKSLGYLEPTALSAAYESAALVAYPSLSEGFGLPVLEAMAAGAPVLTSNVTSMPEIAGGAAILVDPFSEDAILDGMRRALTESEAERAARVKMGQSVAARFRWSEAAESYLQLYETLL